MKLPGVERAEVPEAKVMKYLLSTTHRAGKGKALFFMKFGFDPDRWQELAAALRQHVIDNEIAFQEKTIFGTRYVIDGLLKAPDGTWLNLRRALFVEDEGDSPKFITAHPLKRRQA
jgi:Domain of unknown function (DUF6883)